MVCYRPAVPTSNDRTWHHTMTATAAQLFSLGSPLLFLSRVFTALCCSFFMSHSDVSFFLFPSHFFFLAFPFYSSSQPPSLALSTSVSLIKCAGLTWASDTMLNQGRCSVCKIVTSTFIFCYLPFCRHILYILYVFNGVLCYVYFMYFSVLWEKPKTNFHWSGP